MKLKIDITMIFIETTTPKSGNFSPYLYTLENPSEETDIGYAQ